MNVPLLDLKAQYHTIKEEVDAALLRVAASQYFILGPEVVELERSLAQYVGTSHAIGVSSGTDALLLAMMALGIGPGDAVIVPTFSFFATAGVVARLNATPVFVDCELSTYNISPDAVERAMAQAIRDGLRVRAIVPVHLFGQSADMDAIMDIAARYQLHVIEDAAQAIGTQYHDGRRVGSIGTVGCFSFFPSKNLGCFGDGGIITTNDDELAHRIEIMRVHGGEPKYHHKVIGGNFRLDAIQAAVLNVKLPHLEEWTRGRQHNAEFYTRALMEAGVATRPGVTAFDEKNRVLLPASVHANSGHPFVHIWNQFSIRVKDRDRLVAHLRSKNIGCEIYYPVPFHKQDCFADVAADGASYPNADIAGDTILSLPIYPELTEEMKQYVVDSIVDWCC